MAGNILYIAFIIVLFREQTYRAAAAEVQDQYDPERWLMQQCEKNDDSARAATSMQSFKLCIVNGEIIPLTLRFNTGRDVAGLEFLRTLVTNAFNLDIPKPQGIYKYYIQQEGALLLKNGPNEIVRISCDKSEALLKCVKQLTYDVKPCFTAEDDLEIANVLADRAANFICVEKTSMLKEFIANNGHICYDKKIKDIEKCEEVDGEEGTPLVNIFHIKKKECALLSQYQTCVVQQLRSCPEPTADFYSSFWDTMLEGLSCNRALSFEMSLSRFALMCVTALVAVTAISFK